MQDKEKTVDIDTSGPEVEVELPTNEDDKTAGEDKTHENERETKLEDNNQSDDSNKEFDKLPDVPVQEDKRQESNKKELDEYSDGVKRRIAKLTKKMREAERREEAATLYAKGVLEEQEKLKLRLSKIDTSYVSEMEGRIKSGMEAVVAKLAKAREENNLKDEVAASAEISRLGYEEAKLLDMKTKQASKKEETPIEQPQEINQPTRRVDPNAQEWAEKNPWFNKDRVMTEAAKVIHKKLVEEEGHDPISDPEAYYKEIDRNMALEFPHKFAKKETETTTKPTQTVASATRSSKTGRVKTQRLTPSEVAIAKKLGVPLDKFAEEKQKLLTKEA